MKKLIYAKARETLRSQLVKKKAKIEKIAWAKKAKRKNRAMRDWQNAKFAPEAKKAKST